jgi:hypothetical protein
MVSKTRLQTQDYGLKTDVLRNPYRVFTREAWDCGFQSAAEYGSASASALILFGRLNGLSALHGSLLQSRARPSV